MNPYTLVMIARQRQEAVAVSASNAERRRPARRTQARRRFPRGQWRVLAGHCRDIEFSNRGEAAAVTRQLTNL